MPRAPIRFATSLMLAAGLLALSACGGGGSAPAASADNGSTATLSRANYTSYTAPLARSVLQLADARQFAGLLGGSAAGPQAGAVRSAVLRRALAARPAAATLPAVYDEACDFGGSLHIVLDDRDASGTPSAGDELTVLASDCHVDASGSALNGGFTLDPSTLQLDGAGNLTLLVATGDFNEFAVGSEVMDGGFSVSIGTDGSGTEQISFSFINTTSVGIGPTIVQNTTFTDTIAPDGSSSFSMTGALKIGGASFTLAQPVPFVTPPGADAAALPVAGVVQLADAGGDVLALTAKPGDLIDFTLFIGGVLTESLLDQAWEPFGG
jgi:hypothetical protein